MSPCVLPTPFSTPLNSRAFRLACLLSLHHTANTTKRPLIDSTSPSLLPESESCPSHPLFSVLVKRYLLIPHGAHLNPRLDVPLYPASVLTPFSPLPVSCYYSGESKVENGDQLTRLHFSHEINIVIRYRKKTIEIKMKIV